MKRCLWIILGLLLLPQLTWAATRLGLHVTAEEKAIWQGRRTDNTNTINGITFQTIYTNRILNPATTYKNTANPQTGDGFWVGYTSAGCYPDIPNPPAPTRQNGDSILKSAFVYLLSGDTTYADPVRAVLLNQYVQTGTQFSNTSKWCVTNYDGNITGVALWMIKLIHAYDYLIAGGYTGFTAQQNTDIKNWFRDAGIYYEAKGSIQITQNSFSGARNTPPNYTCNGGACTSGSTGTTHWTGYTSTGVHDTMSNRATAGEALAGLAAVVSGNTTLLNKVKLWFQEDIMFGVFADGTPNEQNRWRDAPNSDQGAGSSWTHAAWNWGGLILIADAVARTGDHSLYDYSTSNGQSGSAGGPKSLLSVMLNEARLANGTLLRYGTNNGTLTSATVLNYHHEGGGEHGEDFQSMMANVYYKNSEVRTAMTRVQSPTQCASYNCWGYPYGTIADTSFMWGNLDNSQINPYSLAPVSNDPVARWPFNEVSGTSAADATGNGHIGTLYQGSTGPQQGPSWIAGQIGNALRCDGLDDNVQVAHAADLDITGDMTIAFWMRLLSTTNLSTNAVVLTKTLGTNETPWHLDLNTPGAPHLNYYHHMNTGNFSAILAFTGHTVPLNTWIHAAFVRTVANNQVKLRVDGVNYASTPSAWGTDNPQASGAAVRLCTNAGRTSTRYANIDLDDLYIYPRALSDVEIDALATANMAPPDPPTNLRIVNQ